MTPTDLQRVQRLTDRDDAAQDGDKDLAWAECRPDPLSDDARAQLHAWMQELEGDVA